MKKKNLPTPKEFLQASTTFILVTIGWVFFRSDTIIDSFIYLNQMIFIFDKPIFSLQLFYILALIILEKFVMKNERDLFLNPFFTSIFIGIIIVNLYFFSENNQFIYFEF